MKQTYEFKKANNIKSNKIRYEMTKEIETSVHEKSLAMYKNRQQELGNNHRRVKYECTKRASQIQSEKIDHNQKLNLLTKIEKTYSLAKRYQVYEYSNPSALLKKVTSFKSLDAGAELLKSTETGRVNVKDLIKNKGYVQDFKVNFEGSKMLNLQTTYFGKRGRPSCNSGYLLKTG